MEIAIIIILILLNGLFSMSELAVISARKTTLQSESKKGNRASKIALGLSENPNTFLSTVQIGITLIGILTGMYSGEQLEYDFRDLLVSWGLSYGTANLIAQPVIVITVTYLTIIFGELVPKRIAMSASVTVAKSVAPFMKMLSVVASPFVWCLAKSTQLVVKVLGIKDVSEKTTEEDIKNAIEEGKQSGEVQEVEQDIVERVFTLGDRKVDSIMTHRSDVVWIDVNMTNEQIRKHISKNLHQIYVVADGSLDHVIGIVRLKDLFDKLSLDGFDIRTVVRQAKYIHDNMEVYRMLEIFKSTNTSFGLIYDEYGSFQGIVTLKDMLDALLGSLQEETSESEIVERADGSWLIDGQCSIFKFLAYFDMEDDFEPQTYNTLGGLMLDMLDHIPSEGESAQWRGFRFEIVDMDGPRIDKLLVTKIPVS